ncbi:phage tail tube protein [Lacticaseibacillus hulanensis]|uniref:phage tail tube protein n=1 Tax=Lacticaseibacillus hulanensis TaxID=2493111 RepID=UPI000FD8287E|nr:phage tail tube protein [Lacticaseibacillus hulanensis]
MDKATQTYINAHDIISSKEGVLFATIDGQNIPLIELTECSAKLEKNKEEVQAIGKRITMNKTTSVKGTGTLSGHLINSNWLKYGSDFLKGGADLYFSISATVSDSTSSLGSQTVSLSDVNMDDIPVIDFNSDDGTMDWESDFTFEDFQLVTPFTSGINQL